MSLADHVIKMTFYKSNPEWVWYDEDEMPHMTDKAPPEAIESYEYWKKKHDETQRTGIIYY